MTTTPDVQQVISQFWSAVGHGYDSSVRHGLSDARERAAAALPLMVARTLDPIVDVARTAGFAQIQLSTLEAVEQIERELTPDLPSFEPRYVLRAVRPPVEERFQTFIQHDNQPILTDYLSPY